MIAFTVTIYVYYIERYRRIDRYCKSQQFRIFGAEDMMLGWMGMWGVGWWGFGVGGGVGFNGA